MLWARKSGNTVKVKTDNALFRKLRNHAMVDRRSRVQKVLNVSFLHHVNFVFALMIEERSLTFKSNRPFEISSTSVMFGPGCLILFVRK